MMTREHQPLLRVQHLSKSYVPRHALTNAKFTARGSSGTASNTSKRRSTSAPTWVSAALSDGEAATALTLSQR